MSFRKFKMGPVFEVVSPYLRKAAQSIEDCKGAIDQFGAIAKTLSGLGSVIAEVDRSAHGDWTDTVAGHAAAAVLALELLEDRDADEFVRAEALEELILALDGLAGVLISGASSLAIREPNVTPKPKVVAALDGAVSVMTDTAFEYSVVADLFREAAGHGQDSLPTPLVYPSARYCGGRPAAAPGSDRVKAPSIAWAPELLLPPDEAMNAGMGRMQDLPERLAQVLVMLEALFLLMAALGISCSCAAQCTAAKNTYVSNKLAKTYADLVATRTYQPKMDVDWQWCCWNHCWVFWWDKWLTTLTTTHNLGGLYTLPPGRPVGVANTVAKQRAAATGLAGLARPATPC